MHDLSFATLATNIVSRFLARRYSTALATLLSRASKDQSIPACVNLSFVFLKTSDQMPTLLPQEWSTPAHTTISRNTRFDRMMHTLTLTYDRQSRNAANQQTKKRRNAAASSSSSLEPSDSDLVPQTPVDAYNGLQTNSLGDGFSVIKLRSDSSDVSRKRRKTSDVEEEPPVVFEKARRPTYAYPRSAHSILLGLQPSSYLAA